MSIGHRSDIGRFAVVPLWILESDVSATAIRLFAVILAKYADRETNQATPSRRTLATDIKSKSTNTVDRALTELKEIGAVTVEARLDDNGDATSNLYTLHLVRGGVAQSAGRRVSPQNDGRVSPQNDHKPESFEPESFVPVIQPIAGQVYRGGDVPKSKIKKKDRHTTHLLCTDVYCLTLDRADKDRQRFRASGLEVPTEDELRKWYTEALEAMEAECPAEPSLWLYKRMTDDIATSQQAAS